MLGAVASKYKMANFKVDEEKDFVRQLKNELEKLPNDDGRPVRNEDDSDGDETEMEDENRTLSKKVMRNFM